MMRQYMEDRDLRAFMRRHGWQFVAFIAFVTVTVFLWARTDAQVEQIEQLAQENRRLNIAIAAQSEALALAQCRSSNEARSSLRLFLDRFKAQVLNPPAGADPPGPEQRERIEAFFDVVGEGVEPRDCKAAVEKETTATEPTPTEGGDP